jgi:hypothetical protein
MAAGRSAKGKSRRTRGICANVGSLAAGERLEVTMDFGGLDLAQKGVVMIVFAADGIFQEIDEAQRVPFIVGRDLFCDDVNARGQKGNFDFADDAFVGGMLADAAKPIARVHEVGLAAMKNSVEEAGVLVLDVLNDFVGGVEMIVPEENGGAGKFAGEARRFGVDEDGLHLRINLID